MADEKLIDGKLHGKQDLRVQYPVKIISFFQRYPRQPPKPTLVFGVLYSFLRHLCTGWEVSQSLP